jgi:hypothetical protein
MSDEAQDRCPQCDLCGHRPPEPQMVTTVHSIRLCPECLRKLEVMPEKLKETVEKFLIGNVL